jgi:O-antigen/teichoic acid export membrane protein
MLVVVVPLFLFAEPLVVAVLGEPYRESGAVLRIVLLAMLLATLNQPIAVADTARGRERFVAAVVLVGSLAGLAGVAVGAAATGAEGAAWGLVLLQALVLLLLTARRSTRARAAIQRHRGPVDARL